ncbi:MAG: ATP-binding protein [Gammaproteobacteria bacterium]|nr:ATP-binding protein [Gammaproteobacteria bacterium]
MNAAIETLRADGLAPEWQRVDVLCHCLAASRRGQEIEPQLIERLQSLQTEVRQLRRGGAWAGLDAPALDSADLDVLACILAPEFEPRVGWMYLDLQPGIAQPYPCPALIQELLALEPHGAQQMHLTLAVDGTLRQRRLIQATSEGPYAPVKPLPGVSARLMGRCIEQTPPPGAVRVTQRADWDDLVLPPERKAMLREFLLWVEQRHTVVDEWGGSPVGGPVALFAGASGTGKTMAASVIASRLGWALFRVDLGRLVSKYIGETEQNLNALFDAADGQPMVLQFDEADSLFGKRGEIKEARDRYANMEVSHLLARIEVHRGPCILTSNLRKHLDPAFARRFQLVVEFPRPDAAARSELWRRLLPPRAPRAPDVRPEFLGNALSLSGGGIRNAALHAAYLAAGESRPISLDHVALAVWRELAKEGREISRTDLGGLACHLPARC